MKKLRHELFPGMDFNDPQHRIKNIPVARMTQKEWFWFAKENYLIMSYGALASGIILFGGLTIYLWPSLVMVLPAIIAGHSLFKLIIKIKNFDQFKETTLYDLWFREYEKGELNE